MQTARSMDLLFEDCEAVLGLFALTRLYVILDGKHGKLYARPNRSPQSLYQYSRIGAVFPPDGMDSKERRARVVPGVLVGGWGARRLLADT